MLTTEHLEEIQNRISTLEQYMSLVVEEIKAINARAAINMDQVKNMMQNGGVAATSEKRRWIGEGGPPPIRPLTEKELTEAQAKAAEYKLAVNDQNQQQQQEPTDYWPKRRLPPMHIDDYRDLLQTENYPGLALVIQNDD